MKRFRLNLLAALIVLIGGMTFASNVPTAAQDGNGGDGQMCCNARNGECCGDACEVEFDNCRACTGWFWCFIKGIG